MDEERKNYWKTIFAESEKKRRRILPVKRNQLSLWLGRLIIAYNMLDNKLAAILMIELVELVGEDEPPQKAPLGYFPPSLQRARNGGLADIIMATMPFKQKLDFLAALLLNRFSDNPEHQKHIGQVAGLMLAADEFRNKMVHSLWEESCGEFSRVKVKTKGRKGLKVEREDANIKQLREAIEVIQFLEPCLYTMTSQTFAKKYIIDYEKVGKPLRTITIKKAYPNMFINSEK
jgi:hypothetical protein